MGILPCTSPDVEQMGFIEWEKETQEIKRGPNYDEIRPLLEYLVDHGDSSPTQRI